MRYNFAVVALDFVFLYVDLALSFHFLDLQQTYSLRIIYEVDLAARHRYNLLCLFITADLLDLYLNAKIEAIWHIFHFRSFYDPTLRMASRCIKFLAASAAHPTIIFADSLAETNQFPLNNLH